MRFTPEQRAHFQEQGYVVVPNFFTERETTAIREEVERLRRDGFLYNVRTEGDGKTPSQVKQNLQLCPMSPHSRLFRILPFHSKVVEAVSELIGDPIVLHIDQVFLKPGRQGTGTNWHQDNAYFKIDDPLKGTAMWTAVHDATVANGTLHVLPGSHREVYPHERDPESNHHIRCYPPEERALPIEISAGGTIFFAYGVAHCTRGNNTDRDRAGIAFHFLNGDAVPATYFQNYDGARMPNPYLSGDSADGGRAVYGEDLRGAWEREVIGE
jgi:ectoine hydroxylase-related dioxygenase (phytanoyl-CoA dioxygenase family)